MEPYDFVFLLSRHSRIDILIQIRNSVQRYWRFYFLLLLNTSCVEPKWCFNLFVRVAEKNAKIAGSLATHMKTQKKRKVFGSPSLLRFVKRALQRNSRLNTSLKSLRPSFHQKIFPHHQDAQAPLIHSHQIWATILGLKILFLRVWTSDHQSFV